MAEAGSVAGEGRPGGGARKAPPSPAPRSAPEVDPSSARAADALDATARHARRAAGRLRALTSDAPALALARALVALERAGSSPAAAERLRERLRGLGAREELTGDDASAFVAVPAAGLAAPEVVRPAWLDAAGALLVRGRLRVPATPARAALDAALRAAAKAARAAGGDAPAGRIRAARAALGAEPTREAEVAAATDALRALEPLGDGAGLRRAVFGLLGELVQRGVHVWPPAGVDALDPRADLGLEPAALGAAPTPLELPAGLVELVDAEAPAGAVLRVERRALLDAEGTPRDGGGLVRVSRGPRGPSERRLQALLDQGGDALREVALTAARALGALPSAEREGAAAVPLLVELLRAGEQAGPDGAAVVDAALELLRARGLSPLPPPGAKPAALEALAADAAKAEVTRVEADAPRGAVVRVVARGLVDGAGDVLHRATLEVSRGPKDPLDQALAALAAALERSPLPAGATTRLAEEGLAAARAALARGDAPPLPGLAAALVAAQSVPALTTACDGVLAALAPLGVVPLPPTDGQGPRPWPGADLEGRDDPAPPGTPLVVRRRGLALRALAGKLDPLAAADVVVSRGPRPPLLLLLDRLAGAGAPPLDALVAPAGELRRACDAARDAEARAGGAEEAAHARQDVLVQAGVDLARAVGRVAERVDAALEAGTERPASAEAVRALVDEVCGAIDALDPDVEVAPRAGATTVDDPALLEQLEVFDARVPRGEIVRVRRPGVVDRRRGLRRVHPGLVVVSRGARPPLEEALDALLRLAPTLGAPASKATGRLAPRPARTGKLDELVAAVRAAARRLDDAEALGTAGDPVPLAEAAGALLDAVEERALERDPAGESLAAVLDGPLLQGLARHGIESHGEGTTGSVSARRAFADARAGAVLGVARRALKAGGRTVRKGEVLLSLGPRPPLLRLPDALEPLLEGLPDGVKAPLAARLGLERAVEAELVAGRPVIGTGAPRDRALAMLEAVDGARTALTTPADLRAALEGVVDGPLREALETEGLVLFPRPGQEIAPDLLAREGAFAALEGRADPAPRGQVVEVLAYGLLERPPGTAPTTGGANAAVLVPGGSSPALFPTVRRPARVAVSLGVDPRFVAALDGAASADGTGKVGPLVQRLRDPRQVVPDAEALDVLFSAWQAAGDQGRGPLAAGLQALGAAPFPAAGEAWPPAGLDAGPSEVRRAWSDAPAGAVLRVVEPGLRRGSAVVRRAVVEVSRGQPTPLQRALGDAADAVARAGGSPELAKALEAAAETIDGQAAPEQALVDALSKLEEAGRSDAGQAIARLLAERGVRALPVAPGGDWEALQAEAGAGAFDPPRKALGPEPAGRVLSIDRRAVVGPSGVLKKGLVRVSAGPPTELSLLADGLRPGLAANLTGDALAAALAELDDVAERIVSAHPERGYLLSMPLVNLLQKHELKDKLGKELKAYMTKQGIKDIIAFPGYEANKLGPSRLEESRVKSDRPKGHIVKVLRPGFEKGGEVIQKVQAQVSR